MDKRVYVEREVTGVVAMRVLLSMFVVLLMGTASAHAQVYHGNDTGGIISWSCENEAAARRLDDPRGWVAKDAESASLIAAVERLLTPATEAAAGPLPLALIGVLVLILAALVLYLVWTAVV